MHGDADQLTDSTWKECRHPFHVESGMPEHISQSISKIGPGCEFQSYWSQNNLSSTQSTNRILLPLKFSKAQL